MGKGSPPESRLERRRRLLQIGPLPTELETELALAYDLHPLWREANPAAFCAARGGDFDGVVTRARDGCTAEVLRSLAPGSVVACFGIGHEAIDLSVARERDIQVSVTPDVMTACVADIAMGLVIACARRIVAADRFVRRGDWLDGPFPLTTRVSGKRLGIVGLGKIGSAIARRASGFDMEIRYHGRRARAEAVHRFEPDIVALAHWADFLVLSCVGGKETHHLVSAAVLQALGPAGFLINVARGSVVDEQALLDALANDRIAGAGLDVHADEPRVPAQLLADDRVVVLPHIAAFTRETRADTVRLVADNLRAFFTDRRVLTPAV